MKSLLKEMEEKFKTLEEVGYDSENHLGVKESNYIEVSIRDARLALELYADIARNYRNIVLYGSNVYASNNSEEISDLLHYFDKQAIEINSEHIDNDDDLDEQNVTGAVAGFNTPAAFAKPGRWKSKSVKYESVNTPPTYKIGEHQKPESEEEVMNDKFPFAGDDTKWYHHSYEFPHKHMPNKPARTKKIDEILDSKYIALIEEASYTSFKKLAKTKNPDKYINETIRNIAKQIREIDELVNYSAKYKLEHKITSEKYGSRTKHSLKLISEKLIKISERIRALGE